MGFQQRESGLVVKTVGCVVNDCGSTPTEAIL